MSQVKTDPKAKRRTCASWEDGAPVMLRGRGPGRRPTCTILPTGETRINLTRAQYLTLVRDALPNGRTATFAYGGVDLVRLEHSFNQDNWGVDVKAKATDCMAYGVCADVVPFFLNASGTRELEMLEAEEMFDQSEEPRNRGGAGSLPGLCPNCGYTLADESSSDLRLSR